MNLQKGFVDGRIWIPTRPLKNRLWRKGHILLLLRVWSWAWARNRRWTIGRLGRWVLLETVRSRLILKAWRYGLNLFNPTRRACGMENYRMEDIQSGDGSRQLATWEVYLGFTWSLTSKLDISFDPIISNSYTTILRRLLAPSLDLNQQNSSSIIGNLIS